MEQGFDIVAFTEVSTSRPLYERDIMNAVCLPDGARMALTYRKKWIEDRSWEFCTVHAARSQHWNPFRASRKSLSMLIVLYERHMPPGHRFLPLRFAALQSIEIQDHLTPNLDPPNVVEPGATLYVTLGGKPGADLFDPLGRILKDCEAIHNEANLAKFLCCVDRTKLARAQADNLFLVEGSWQQHFGMISRRSDSLRGERHWVVFSTPKPIRHRADAKGLMPIAHSSLHATTFSLRGGKNYEINCHLPEGAIGPRAQPPIAASVVGTHVEVYPAGITQTGGGALVNFLLATQRKFGQEMVGINFTVLGETDNGMEVVRRGKAPEFHFRVDIGPSKWYWVFMFLALSVSAILLNLPADILQGATVWLTGAALVQPIPVVYSFAAICAKAVGAIVVAGISIFALRKMPVGK